MRIGCLQFAPQVGDVDNNLNRADAILNRSMPGDLDLLVLPEMAFSGYNFQSLRDISPFLEPTGAGITSVWARTTALKHDCKVVVGYPEKVDVAQKWPTSPEYYNSAIVVNEEGETLGNYRKSHLYYIDETWALEGSGFFKRRLDGIGKVAMGICMDINPYKFEAPWSSFEFAFHVLDVRANVVIISMAWLTRADASTFSCKPKEPDMETMTYWVTRLEPLIRAESEEEIIVIFANRTGVEDEAVYAGTSAVIGVKEGEVTVYGILGRGEKELLVVDTDTPGFAKLVYRPEDLTVPMPRGERRPSSIGSSNESVASGSSDETATTADDVPVITASTTSTTSTTSVTSVTSTTSTATATPVDSDRRSLFGHIFIDTDVVNTPGPKVRQDTPMSPRYYWNRTPAGAPLSSQFPNKGIHESFAEWHEARKSRENTPANRAVSDSIAPNGNNQSRDHALTNGSHISRAASVDPHERPQSTKARNASCERADIERPGSTKVRNASCERSQIERPPSTKVRNASCERSEIDRPQSLKVRNASLDRSQISRTASRAGHRGHSRSGSVNQDRGFQTFPSRDIVPEIDDTISVDMNKLDVDLMVFEKDTANRRRRDSLECHVDEDNYIAIRAMRKELRKEFADKKKRSEGDESPRPPSRGVRHFPDASNYSSSRSRTNSSSTMGSPRQNQTVEQASPRPPSRGRHRTNSGPRQKSSSKDVSHHHASPKIGSPLVGSDSSRRPSNEASRHHTQRQHSYQNAKQHGKTSPPSRHHQYEPSSKPRTHSRGKSPGTHIKSRYGERIYVPGRGSPSSHSHVPIKYTPGASNSSPSTNGSSSYESTESHRSGSKARERFPPRILATPKPMVLPPFEEPGSGNESSRSAPVPEKNLEPIITVKVLPTSPEVDPNRPRSALW